jgi:hypothetical protein
MDDTTTGSQAPNDSGAVDTKFFGECTKAWAAYFPEKAGVRVEVTNRKGKAVLSLKDVSLEQMEQFTALLVPPMVPARGVSQIQARG